MSEGFAYLLLSSCITIVVIILASHAGCLPINVTRRPVNCAAAAADWHESLALVLEVSFRDSHRLSLFARFIPRHMFSSAFSAVELRRRLSFFHCVFLSFFVSSFALDCSSDCSQEEPLLQSNGKGMS